MAKGAVLLAALTLLIAACSTSGGKGSSVSTLPRPIPTVSAPATTTTLVPITTTTRIGTTYCIHEAVGSADGTTAPTSSTTIVCWPK
jgi:hypothetical protein